MSTTIVAPPESALELGTEPQPRPIRWTREEYERLADEGYFQARRVELIEGEILQMAAQKGPHVASVILTGNRMRAGFEPGHVVRIQAPLNLLDGSAPEPDVAIVPGSPRDYSEHPHSALLVIEVSDTTLVYDLGKKARLYARNGIPEYWVIDLIGRRVVVHRNPDADTGDWSDRQSVGADGTVHPSLRPDFVVKVADLLP